MNDLSKKMRAHREHRKAIEDAVLRGEVSEKCFTCKARATHISKGITPAGYRAFQCDKHAINEKSANLWGSDPGWATEYVALPQKSSP